MIKRCKPESLCFPIFERVGSQSSGAANPNIQEPGKLFALAAGASLAGQATPTEWPRGERVIALVKPGEDSERCYP